MTQTRDFGAELDALNKRMDDLQQLVSQIGRGEPAGAVRSLPQEASPVPLVERGTEQDAGGVYYSGTYRRKNQLLRWEPQERRIAGLLELDGEKAAKVLAALGHRQRLDILRTVTSEPLTGAELVEQLNMGTTGQLYHHIKALTGADLLIQEDRGGKYTIPEHRTLPLLLLMAAVSDLLDTSDYLDMTEARNNAGAYLGPGRNDYDPHLLLWAVVENSILEHRAGFCSEVGIFLHSDGSVTVSDNGRGIPVSVLPNSAKPQAQSVLTDMNRHGPGASYVAPGCEKGIGIATVNALSERLSVEIRRKGKVFRQDYRRGIPQTGLITVGITKETGTSVTFEPDRELFRSSLDRTILDRQASEICAAYPGLTVLVHAGEG